jgi:hypothetical protein
LALIHSSKGFVIPMGEDPEKLLRKIVKITNDDDDFSPSSVKISKDCALSGALYSNNELLCSKVSSLTNLLSVISTYPGDIAELTFKYSNITEDAKKSFNILNLKLMLQEDSSIISASVNAGLAQKSTSESENNTSKNSLSDIDSNIDKGDSDKNFVPKKSLENLDNFNNTILVVYKSNNLKFYLKQANSKEQLLYLRGKSEINAKAHPVCKFINLFINENEKTNSLDKNSTLLLIVNMDNNVTFEYDGTSFSKFSKFRILTACECVSLKSKQGSSTTYFNLDNNKEFIYKTVDDGRLYIEVDKSKLALSQKVLLLNETSIVELIFDNKLESCYSTVQSLNGKQSLQTSADVAKSKEEVKTPKNSLQRFLLKHKGHI